jgi:hypothetical protein
MSVKLEGLNIVRGDYEERACFLRGEAFKEIGFSLWDDTSNFTKRNRLRDAFSKCQVDSVRIFFQTKSKSVKQK